MDVKLYVVSTASDQRYALEPENLVIVVSASGPDPLADARTYAFGHTGSTGGPTWVYRVELEALGSYSIERSVVYKSAVKGR